MRRLAFISSILLMLLIGGQIALSNETGIGWTETYISELAEQLSSENEQTLDFTSLYEDLKEIALKPINLNNTNRDELHKLPFLNDIQIENIEEYIYKADGIKTIYELKLIDGMDSTTISRLRMFVHAGEKKDKLYSTNIGEILKATRYEFVQRMDKGLEQKSGYSGTPNSYLGDNIALSTKCKINYSDRIYIGITNAKDAGEQFWSANQKGFDYNSGYIQLNNLGVIKTIIMGDYKANFGQGLIMHQAFAVNKSSYVTNVLSANSNIQRHTSTDEYNYLRGASAVLKLNSFQLTAFCSSRMLDADTTGGTFSSIYTTGLHRTAKELSTKSTVNNKTIGIDLNINSTRWQLGIASVYMALDKSLIRSDETYNALYFKGKNQISASGYYRILIGKASLWGETAVCGNKTALATINGVSLSPLSTFSLVALYRNYSPEYDAFYARAFSASSKVNNEHGFYVGAEIKPVSGCKISTYIETYRSIWPKFLVDAPSSGISCLVQTQIELSKSIDMCWRLKYDINDRNNTLSEITSGNIINYKKGSLKYILNKNNDRWKFKNLFELNFVRKGSDNPLFGCLFSSGIGYDFEHIPLKVDLSYKVFDAVDYENRFYSYEQDVLYAFSVPMMYGIGSRYYLNLKYEINRHCFIYFKYTQTTFADDRTSISSGLETIYGNKTSDIHLSLLIKL